MHAVIRILGCCTLFLPLGFPVFARQITRADTSSAVHRDSTRIDTTAKATDTTSAGGVDTLVTYSSADSIVYSLSTRMMSLYGKGDIKYRQMALKSERIDINWDSSIMTATGVKDTADSTGRKMRGTPVMKDGGEEYHSKELQYDFKSKKGLINIGDTQIDQGYYHGEDIKKVGTDVLFVENGRYTTCDKPDPDYYFMSPKMKVIMKDQIIAEPVYFYVADVPVFWLPLAVFPNKAGRRSGIIAPAIAEDATHGRLLRHLGYYFAISDYMDLNFMTDLYTKGSWAALSSFRYALRYNFTGGISGLYRKMIAGETTDPTRTTDESYNLNITHRQEIDPTTRLDVDFTFASNNSYRNTIDLNQGLNQSIFSNATLSKSWEGTPNSVTLNLSRTLNLIDGSSSEVLPSFSFNHSQSYPFRFGKGPSADISKLSWYEMIGMSYGASITNTRAKVSRTVSGVKVNLNGIDTTQSVQDYEIDRGQALNQNFSLNIAPKLGHFTISPSVNYQDVRSFSNNDVPGLNSDSSFQIANVTGKHTLGTLSTGVAASTKLYGIVQPQLLGVGAIRHTLTPSLSFTYVKQVVGENLGPKQMLMGLSVGNVLEMKTMTAGEEAEPTKIQLMNIGLGLSYDFAADSLNFSPLGVSYRTDIGKIVNIGGSASYDLYKLEEIDPTHFVRVNRFLLADQGRLARLTNFGISLSTTLAGEKKKSTPGTTPLDTTAQQRARRITYGIYNEEEPDFSIPWQLNLSFSYAESRVPPFPSRSANLNGHLDFNLTENWKFSMQSSYDLVNAKVIAPEIRISRDLHCWIMNFEWVPIGNYRHYQFEIRLKAPQLQDIKVTKQGSESGIY